MEIRSNTTATEMGRDRSSMVASQQIIQRWKWMQSSINNKENRWMFSVNRSEIYVYSKLPFCPKFLV